MYENILLPLDGSAKSEEAINTARALAKVLDARVVLMQVEELLLISSEDRAIEEEHFRKRALAYLNGVKPGLENEGICVDVVIKLGQPGLEICKYAERDDIDLIIISPHGASGVTRWAIGSVSNKIMNNAPKPVLLARVPLASPLQGRVVLVVDDEQDVLDSVEEVLDICTIFKASDYQTASDYLKSYSFDIVILDIMGVKGFDLLKESVQRGFPTVMLTAHAFTEATLKESAKLGAVSFLPKEEIENLKPLLEDVVRAGGKPVWKKLFERIGTVFERSFGRGEGQSEELLKKIQRIFEKEFKNPDPM